MASRLTDKCKISIMMSSELYDHELNALYMTLYWATVCKGEIDCNVNPHNQGQPTASAKLDWTILYDQKSCWFGPKHVLEIMVDLSLEVRYYHTYTYAEESLVDFNVAVGWSIHQTTKFPRYVVVCIILTFCHRGAICMLC